MGADVSREVERKMERRGGVERLPSFLPSALPYLATPFLFASLPSLCSSTVTTKLSSGAVHRVVVAAKAGQSVRFRWFARSSGVKFGLTFVPTPGAAPVFVGNTTTGSLPGVQEAVKEVGMCGEGFSGAVAVLALKEYEDSGKGAIHAEHTAPAAGWWVATWDNHKGWRGKEITHRWDYLVNGVPECSLVAAERSRRDTAAAAAGKAAAAAAAASTGGSAATATA